MGVFPNIQTTASVLRIFSFSLQTMLYIGNLLKFQRSQERSLPEPWLHWEQSRIRPQGSLQTEMHTRETRSPGPPARGQTQGPGRSLLPSEGTQNVCLHGDT